MRRLAPPAALLGLLLLSGCAPTGPLEVAQDLASDDLDCPQSDIHVLDFAGSSDGMTETVRLFACGHEVVYQCHEVRSRYGAHWSCERSGYRFPG
jgi:hypothetical protein